MSRTELLSKMPSTWQEFYIPCQPENLFSLYYDVKTIYDSISKNRVTIGEVTRQYGSFKHKRYGECDFGVLYFYEWLTYLNEVSNINKPLPPKEITRISRMLFLDYHHFYIADLKLILMGILEGDYGNFFGSLDSQLVFRAFKEYNAKRNKLIKDIQSDKADK